MKKKKLNRVYFVEIRRRIKKGSENESLRNIFGGFSTVRKAEKYIQTEGRQIVRDFARGHKQKDLFFVVLCMDIDYAGCEMPIAEKALDLDGGETYWFRTEK